MINGGRGVVGGRGVGSATIRNVLNARNRTTELWIADALLCAIGAPGRLRYESKLSTKQAIELRVVNVIQNPNTGRECGC